MLQGPVLQGTTSFEYTLPGSLHCSFKINDTKDNSTKNIKKQQTTFQTFSTQTHTHTETHHTTTNLPRCCWCFNLCNLLCFHELHQVCESVSQARKAHENWFPLVRTNLKMMMSSNFCKKSNQNAEKRQPKAAFGSQKQTPKPLFLEIPRIKRQKQYLTPPHRTTPTTNPGA